MPPNMIDPVQFGQLINAVDTLKDNVQTLTIQMADLNHKMATGKGIAIGLVMVSGSAGAALMKIIDRVF